MRSQKIEIPKDSTALYGIDEDGVIYLIVAVNHFQQYEYNQNQTHYVSLSGANLLISSKSKAKFISVVFNDSIIRTLKTATQFIEENKKYSQTEIMSKYTSYVLDWMMSAKNLRHFITDHPEDPDVYWFEPNLQNVRSLKHRIGAHEAPNDERSVATVAK